MTCEPQVGVKVPSGAVVQGELPVVEYLPGMHWVAVHAVQALELVEPVASVKVFGGQGVGAAAPSRQYDMAGHGEQAMLPGRSLYIPALQAEQVALEMAPVAEEVVPGGQGVQSLGCAAPGALP